MDESTLLQRLKNAKEDGTLSSAIRPVFGLLAMPQIVSVRLASDHEMEDAELLQISTIPSARLVLSQSVSSSPIGVNNQNAKSKSPKMSQNPSHEAFVKSKKISVPL